MGKKEGAANVANVPVCVRVVQEAEPDEDEPAASKAKRKKGKEHADKEPKQDKEKRKRGEKKAAKPGRLKHAKASEEDAEALEDEQPVPELEDAEAAGPTEADRSFIDDEGAQQCVRG